VGAAVSSAGGAGARARGRGSAARRDFGTAPEGREGSFGGLSARRRAAAGGVRPADREAAAHAGERLRGAAARRIGAKGVVLGAAVLEHASAFAAAGRTHGRRRPSARRDRSCARDQRSGAAPAALGVAGATAGLRIGGSRRGAKRAGRSAGRGAPAGTGPAEPTHSGVSPRYPRPGWAPDRFFEPPLLTECARAARGWAGRRANAGQG